MDYFIWNGNPEIFSIGAFRPRWYGLMFAIGFALSYKIIAKMFRRDGLTEEHMSSGLVSVVLGTIIGARLGHCLLYQPDYYLPRPWEILMIWQGGLASHGGFLGVVIALYLYVKKYKEMTFLELCDRVAVPSLMTAGFIRIGNFFNSEILGSPAQVPWAVVFQKVDQIPRHPSMLYEAAAYLLGFIAVYQIYFRTQLYKSPGRIFGLCLAYGFTARFFIEFLKENQVDFENGMLINMGQLLSLPFIALGIMLALNQFKKLIPVAQAPHSRPQKPQKPHHKRKS